MNGDDGGVLRSEYGLTWMAGGKSGVKSTRRRVREAEREADS